MRWIPLALVALAFVLWALGMLAPILQRRRSPSAVPGGWERLGLTHRRGSVRLTEEPHGDGGYIHYHDGNRMTIIRYRLGAVGQVTIDPASIVDWHLHSGAEQPVLDSERDRIADTLGEVLTASDRRLVLT